MPIPNPLNFPKPFTLLVFTVQSLLVLVYIHSYMSKNITHTTHMAEAKEEVSTENPSARFDQRIVRDLTNEASYCSFVAFL
jgi:hypothetical protein